MNHIIISILVLGSLFSAPLKAQKIEVMDFEQLQPELQKQDDTVRVINFWATWCIPCVEEMPYFVSIQKQYQHEKVKILLVSLDFPSNIESRVIPFIKKHNITSEVVLLDDPDANAWINKVNSDWSGALPATIIYKKENRTFMEGGITREQLQKYINQIL